MSEALRTVERRLLFVAWLFGPRAMPAQFTDRAYSAESMESLARAVVARSGLEYIDLVLLDDPGQQDLSADGMAMLKKLGVEGLVRLIGIAGQGDEIDAYISTGLFDVLATPFNMLSGSRERRRMKAAAEQNMAVLGYGPYPEAMLKVIKEAAPKKGLLSWGKKPGAKPPEPYAFLHSTGDWTAEEVCLAYALTEPGVATMQIEPHDADHVRELADVAERELPAGLPAQIEMSRFSGLGGQARRA